MDKGEIKQNIHWGPTLKSFLEEEGMLEEADAYADRKIAEAMTNKIDSNWKTFDLKIPDELNSQLIELAKLRGVSKEILILEALEKYLPDMQKAIYRKQS